MGSWNGGVERVEEDVVEEVEQGRIGRRKRGKVE